MNEAGIHRFYFQAPGDIGFSIETPKANFGFSPEGYVLLNNFVPQVTILQHEPTSVSFNIKNYTSEEPSVYFDLGLNEIVIYDNWGKHIPFYVVHLIYSNAHRIWLQKGIYAIHSSCLVREGQAILLVGASGSGKTTVSLELIKKYNYQLFSGNKTLITSKNGRFIVLAGTTTITHKDNQKIEKRIKHGSSIVTFTDRIAYELGIQYIYKGDSVPISKIYFIRLNSYMNEIKSKSPFEAALAIYPNMLDLNNCDTILFDGRSIFPGGSSDPSMRLKAIREARTRLNELQAHEIVGSLEFITQEINAL